MWKSSYTKLLGHMHAIRDASEGRARFARFPRFARRSADAHELRDPHIWRVG